MASVHNKIDPSRPREHLALPPNRECLVSTQDRWELRRWGTARLDPFQKHSAVFDTWVSERLYPTIKEVVAWEEKCLENLLAQKPFSELRSLCLKEDVGPYFPGDPSQDKTSRLRAQCSFEIPAQPFPRHFRAGERGCKMFRSVGDRSPKIEDALEDIQKQFRSFFGDPANLDKVPALVAVQVDRTTSANAIPEEKDAGHRIIAVVYWKKLPKGATRPPDQYDLVFEPYFKAEAVGDAVCREVKKEINQRVTELNAERQSVVNYSVSYRYGDIPGMANHGVMTGLMFTMVVKKEDRTPPRQHFDVFTTMGGGGTDEAGLNWLLPKIKESFARNATDLFLGITNYICWVPRVETVGHSGARCFNSVLYEENRGLPEQTTRKVAGNLDVRTLGFVTGDGPDVFSAADEDAVGNAILGKYNEQAEKRGEERVTFKVQYDWGGFSMETLSSGTFRGIEVVSKKR